MWCNTHINTVRICSQSINSILFLFFNCNSLYAYADTIVQSLSVSSPNKSHGGPQQGDCAQRKKKKEQCKHLPFSIRPIEHLRLRHNETRSQSSQKGQLPSQGPQTFGEKKSSFLAFQRERLAQFCFLPSLPQSTTYAGSCFTGFTSLRACRILTRASEGAFGPLGRPRT